MKNIARLICAILLAPIVVAMVIALIVLGWVVDKTTAGRIDDTLALRNQGKGGEKR